MCLIDKGPVAKLHGRSFTTAFLYASLLQATDSVVSLAPCLQVMSQAPQHFRSFETQPNVNGCFSRQSGRWLGRTLLDQITGSSLFMPLLDDKRLLFQDSIPRLNEEAWSEYHFFKTADYLDHLLACFRFVFNRRHTLLGWLSLIHI